MIARPKPRRCAGCGRRITQPRHAGRTRIWCEEACRILARNIDRAERRLLDLRQAMLERGRPG